MDVYQLDIRLAKARDAQAIALMSRDLIEHGLGWSWTRARVMRSIECPDTNVVVACTSHGLVGFGIMQVGYTKSHLNLLAVRPAYQRRGLGKHILRWLEASAATAGNSSVTLEFRASNDRARQFYARLGYEEQGRIPGYYSGQETAIRMNRALRLTTGKGPD